jgi:hypothetical protein
MEFLCELLSSPRSIKKLGFLLDGILGTWVKQATLLNLPVCIELV